MSTPALIELKMMPCTWAAGLIVAFRKLAESWWNFCSFSTRSVKLIKLNASGFAGT